MLRHFLFVALVSALCCPLAGQSLEKNLEDARSCLRKKAFKDAEFAARTALAADSGHQEAYLLLQQALTGAGDTEGALLAALDAFNAPKRGAKTAAQNTRAARDLVANGSPKLAAFLALRSGATQQLLRIRDAATRQKRSSDSEWSMIQVFRLAPTEEVVAKESRGVSEQFWRQRGRGGVTAMLETDFVPLTEIAKDWLFAETHLDSKADGPELLIKSNGTSRVASAYFAREDRKTGSGFVLRASFMWAHRALRDAQAPPRLYIQMSTATRPAPGNQFVCISPYKNSSTAGYLVAEQSGPLSPLAEEPIAYESIGDGRWFSVELRWSARTDKLQLLLEDKIILTASTQGRSPKGYYLGFACGNCEQLRVRNARYKAQSTD